MIIPAIEPYYMAVTARDFDTEWVRSAAFIEPVIAWIVTETDRPRPIGARGGAAEKGFYYVAQERKNLLDMLFRIASQHEESK